MNAITNDADRASYAPAARDAPANDPRDHDRQLPQPAAAAAPAPGRRRRRLRAVLLLVGPLLLLIGAGYLYVTGARYVSTDNAYVKADMAAISPEVSGRVIEVAVADNQEVAAGALLFRIDDRPFQLAVAQAEATLENIRNDITALEASYRQKQAEIELAQSNVEFYERELKIYQGMAAGKVVAQTQLDEASHNLTEARQQLPALRQELAGILAQLGGQPDLAPETHPRYLAAKAQLDQARLDLEHTVVAAPASGILSNVTLRPGDYVRAGASVFSLVETDHLWVEANFKETDLTHVVAGQPATVEIDTYPGVVWQTRVGSISPASGAEFALLPPQNSTGNWVKVVQRIPVRLDVESRAGQPVLRAGMSATIEIDTGYRRPLPGLVRSALAWIGAAQ
ncbi:MAG: HlyD family secretion protein [Dongiaceae bacterium]